MNLTGKVIIALLVGTAVYAVAHFVPTIHPAILVFTATLATALLTSISAAPAETATKSAPRSPSKPKASKPKSSKPKASQAAASGPREEGEVKWFNVSKGFGFITKDDGEELFVHFRSIRGEGRRSLRDGQRVSFVEEQSDKGPQAEDVEPL